MLSQDAQEKISKGKDWLVSAVAQDVLASSNADHKTFLLNVGYQERVASITNEELTHEHWTYFLSTSNKPVAIEPVGSSFGQTKLR